MPEIKVSDLPDYETPDSNDYVLVLERSNSLPTTFKTYKTEVNSLLNSDVVNDAIQAAVVSELGSLNDVIGRLTYNTTNQQLVLAANNEFLVNDVRIYEEDGSGNVITSPSEYSVVPKKYIDAKDLEYKTYLEGLINNLSANNFTTAGGILTGDLTLSEFQNTSNERSASSVGYVKSYVQSQSFISANGATITGNLFVPTPTSSTMAANKGYVDATVATGVTGIDTDGIPEGTNNLYFTDARAQAAITVTGDLTYTGGVLSYTGLTTADLPTALSELTNDMGFIGTSGLADYPLRSEISAVGFSNNYADLINKPNIPDMSTVIVSTAGPAGIPLANVVSAAGISGSFDDLSNKPLGVYGSVEGLLQFVQTINMQGDGLENIATTNFQGLDAIQVNVRAGTGINVSATVYDNTDPANPVYVSGGEVSVDDTVFATKTYVDNAILTVDNTDEMTEGTTNLYYTDARVDARTSSPGHVATAAQYAGTITTNPADNTDTTAYILGNTGQSASGASTGWFYGDIISDPTNPSGSVRVLDVDNAVINARIYDTNGNVLLDNTSGSASFGGDIHSHGSSSFSGTVDFTGATLTGITTGQNYDQSLNTTDDVTFNKVTTNELAFGGTGPVTFTSGNNLAFNATGTITFNGAQLVVSTNDLDTHLNTSTATSGQVLSWTGTDYDWVTQSTSTSSSITAGNSSVAVADTGTDGEVTITTEGTARWDITSSGHLLPVAHETYDIGSAERKVRHLFLSDNSLTIGDTTFSEANVDRSMEVYIGEDAPASATATGKKGDVRIVDGFMYVCTDTDTWVRSSIETSW